MEEVDMQLMSATEVSGAAGGGEREADQVENLEMQFGSFVALRRIGQVSVEAVRMQGCVGGVGAC
jgi:hypothetical protein